MSDYNDKISEYILEVRYKASAKFFDSVGRWTDSMARQLSLPKWNLIDNGAEVRREDGFEKAFSTFHNFGYKVVNPSTDNYFLDKVVKFLNAHLLTNAFSENILYIERIGVRGRCVKKFNGSFEDLRGKFIGNYINITKEAQEILKDAKVEDIGILLNFSDSEGNFNTSCGPMLKDQIKQYFDCVKKDDILFDTGYYIDVDFWVVPQKEMKKEEIISKVRNFCNALNIRSKQIEKIITK